MAWDSVGSSGIADKPPEARLAQAGFPVVARFVESPGPGFPIQIVAAVVGDHDLLAEPVVAVGRAALAFAAPHADQGQQRQQRVIQVGALAQIRGIGGNRQIVERRDVAGRGHFGAFSRGSHRSVAGVLETGWPVGAFFRTHDSSVMSR